jgi:two-component system response regulator PilR (NtrC family)
MFPPPPESILLVDDNPVILRLLGATLRQPNVLAGGVAEACLLLERSRFTSVISDLNLGDGDGLEVLQVARAQQPWARRWLLCADADERANAALASGLASGLIPKPWTVATLRALVP